MILQMVKNECVRFGGHVDIEVRYKILRLDVLKDTPILHNLYCFKKGLLGDNFDEKHPWSLRG
jgi:hypothetical protein